jgi:hypothetical protein
MKAPASSGRSGGAGIRSGARMHGATDVMAGAEALESSFLTQIPTNAP